MNEKVVYARDQFGRIWLFVNDKPYVETFWGISFKPDNVENLVFRHIQRSDLTWNELVNVENWLQNRALDECEDEMRRSSRVYAAHKALVDLVHREANSLW